MGHWPEEEARKRLEELLEATLRDGPQFVTRSGVEAAVMVSIGEWRRLTAQVDPLVETPNERKTLKELLLADEPRFDLDLPPRRRRRRSRTG
jgi:antitoxin Phd